jgi:hypothetical protein
MVPNPRQPSKDRDHQGGDHQMNRKKIPPENSQVPTQITEAVAGQVIARGSQPLDFR